MLFFGLVAIGLTACGGGSTDSANSARGSVTLPAASTTTTPAFPEALMLPTSDDPEMLAQQLYSNFQNAINTNDLSFLGLFYTSTSATAGPPVQAAIAKMQQIHGIQLTSPSYHHNIKVLGATSPVPFTPQDTSRTLTVNLDDQEIEHNGAETVDHPGVQTLTLAPTQRTYNSGAAGEQTVTVWLITDVENSTS